MKNDRYSRPEKVIFQRQAPKPPDKIFTANVLKVMMGVVCLTLLALLLTSPNPYGWFI